MQDDCCTRQLYCGLKVSVCRVAERADLGAQPCSVINF